ncbi:unnamed protein product [Adineta ricciae]|uniref:Uncharacterized protein n=1 Tax=Adineta ricciae TaxID=249248 RepID=A0A815ZJP1_ADIRI|nr:unnamed protein product [Adineta ricciae]
MYYTSWRQKPRIPPRRGKHYNMSTVGPPMTISVYPPTRVSKRLGKIFGNDHSIMEICQTSIDINTYLPICLRPVLYPALTDRIKHKICSANSVVHLLRRSQVQNQAVIRPNDKIQLIDDLSTNRNYNFVLLGDGRLIYSQVPHGKYQYPCQLLTKHVILAGCSHDVRFAGEMRKSDNGEMLLINNSSGTYQPDDRMLPNAAAYFQRLFPHVLVQRASRC